MSHLHAGILMLVHFYIGHSSDLKIVIKIKKKVLNILTDL